MLRNDQRILMLANTSWYLANFRASTIKNMVSNGYAVTCIAPKDDYSHKLTELGAEYLPVNLNGASTNPLRELWQLTELYTIIKRTKPVIIFNFTIKINIYAGICAHLLKIPYVNNVSGLGTAFIYNSPALVLARQLYGYSNRRAARVFFQNEVDQSQFIEQGLVNPGKAKLLPGSGIDTKSFSEQPLPDGPLTFLMIARLIADKGIREFVSAAKAVKNAYPDTVFVLLGPNAVQNHSAITNEELSAWRQEGVVELPGSTDDVRPWLKACHVLVLPSYREGMPRTVLEAAAVGRPAIVTDVPGCRQSIVPGETGWLCKVRNHESLAQQMIHVIENQHLVAEFGTRAAERVRRNFSDEIVINEYLKCLESLTAK